MSDPIFPVGYIDPAILAQRAQAALDRDTARVDAVAQYLATHTPAECADYVMANVTDLPSARALMAKFAIVLCVLAKRELR